MIHFLFPANFYPNHWHGTCSKWDGHYVLPNTFASPPPSLLTTLKLELKLSLRCSFLFSPHRPPFLCNSPICSFRYLKRSVQTDRQIVRGHTKIVRYNGNVTCLSFLTRVNETDEDETENSFKWQRINENWNCIVYADGKKRKREEKQRGKEATTMKSARRPLTR